MDLQVLSISTFEGVATQQVITIPVSQLAGNQIVQLVASNGQIFTTTLANLQAMSQPVPVPGLSAQSMSNSLIYSIFSHVLIKEK